MIMCLAQQLAEQLPQMAATLVPVVKEFGNAADLTLAETYQRQAYPICLQSV